MSAIFGLINLDSRPVAMPHLEAMSAALRPCGPDGGGIWVDANVGLGQRLMRFTREDDWEDQPAFSADRRRVVVSDARLDNRAELVEELGISSADARALPDSAFILHAYEKWGNDCPAHLIGAFVFALCDLHKRSVLIARSPMAERTLFYFEAPGVFAFSSAPRGLFSLPFVSRGVNPQSIADFLVFSASEPGTSWFSGISRLQAGHRTVVRDGRVQTQVCREIDLNRKIRFANNGDYVEAFKHLFDRVVGDQLRSRSAAGIWLSGGLDSTAIAASALARPRHTKPFHAFTAVPPSNFAGTVPRGWYADETPFVEAMARHYENLQIHFIRSGKSSWLDQLTPFIEATESPVLGPGHLAWTSPLQREARELNARVLLTGTLGNFTISYGGQALLPKLMREGKWTRAFQLTRALARGRGILPALRTAAGAGVLPLLPDSLWLAAERLRGRGFEGFSGERYWKVASPIHPEFARRQRVDERVRTLIQHFRPSRQPAGRAMAMLWRADRRADLRRGEEIMYGVQNRDLPGDSRLVEFCLSVPEEQYLDGGNSRWLIRRAMEARLPREIRENRRRGVQAAEWFESLSAARPRLRDELDSLARSPLASEMIDLARLEQLAEHFPAAQDEGGRVLLEYRVVLESGLSVGRFLAWVEKGQ